jgi:hypothetical protein
MLIDTKLERTSAALSNTVSTSALEAAPNKWMACTSALATAVDFTTPYCIYSAGKVAGAICNSYI